MWRSIVLLWNNGALLYYRAALSQINPLHDDVPHIVMRILELENGNAK